MRADKSEIAAYEAKLPRILNIPAAAIELRAGEHYGGEILNADGTLNYRIALVAVNSAGHAWAAAGDLAESLGGKRPNRAEAALLIANCKPHMPDSGWFWLDDECEGDASFAWICYFGYGYTSDDHKSVERQAVVVRLIPLTA